MDHQASTDLAAALRDTFTFTALHAIKLYLTSFDEPYMRTLRAAVIDATGCTDCKAERPATTA